MYTNNFRFRKCIVVTIVCLESVLLLPVPVLKKYHCHYLSVQKIPLHLFLSLTTATTFDEGESIVCLVTAVNSHVNPVQDTSTTYDLIVPTQNNKKTLGPFPDQTALVHVVESVGALGRRLECI